MVGLFNRNGKGTLNRAGLHKAIQGLGINITKKESRILVDFVDEKETGIIQIEDLIQTIMENTNQGTKNIN
jgi:Ca2+-binding EF-hand superfamily protein